ncbi:MAG: hypothetical protein HQL52_13645 [Magnetococcales bacterium]|nr:hypothetical protein [Magnetococcales bacterium]
MYIYGDESGNTGKEIFHEPEWYHQGGLICLHDIDPVVRPILRRHCDELGVERIHANEFLSTKNAEIATDIINALDASTTWVFHHSKIHKPYMATTKFVDAIFDSGENDGARWLWYNSEFLRHTLCCLMDDVLTPRNKRRFWPAYLSSNHDEVKACIRNAQTYLDRHTSDRRLQTVVRDAFNHALSNMEKLSFGHSGKSYRKLEAPNIAAFSILINSVHSFAEKHNAVPVAFIHDQSSEFNKTMRKMHTWFSGVQAGSADIAAKVVMVDWGLGNFSSPSSKDILPLQAVDVLLWILQREPQHEITDVQERLGKKTDPYWISRPTSELIRQSWINRLFGPDFPVERLQEGERLAAEVEERFKEKLVQKVPQMPITKLE